MALALLWPEEPGEDSSRVRLHFDIGQNRYYAWQVGDEEQIHSNGISRIANVKERSRLLAGGYWIYPANGSRSKTDSRSC
jgi:hypothetical protein